MNKYKIFLQNTNAFIIEAEWYEYDASLRFINFIVEDKTIATFNTLLMCGFILLENE